MREADGQRKAQKTRKQIFTAETPRRREQEEEVGEFLIWKTYRGKLKYSCVEANPQLLRKKFNQPLMKHGLNADEE